MVRKKKITFFDKQKEKVIRSNDRYMEVFNVCMYQQDGTRT